MSASPSLPLASASQQGHAAEPAPATAVAPRIGAPWVAETIGTSPIRWVLMVGTALALAYLVFTQPGGVTGATSSGPATAAAWALFFAAAPFIFAADAKMRIIPNRILLPLTIAVATLLTFDLAFGALALSGLLSCAVAGTLVGVYAFVIWFFAPESGFGWGDVKLSTLTAVLLGTHSVWLAFFAVVVAAPVLAITAFALANIRRRVTSGPYGPFLVAAAVLVTFAQSHVAAMSPLL